MQITWQVNDQFDLFGEVWTIVQPARRGRFVLARRSDGKDKFGKVYQPVLKNFHVLDLTIARKLERE